MKKRNIEKKQADSLQLENMFLAMRVINLSNTANVLTETCGELLKLCEKQLVNLEKLKAANKKLKEGKR